MFMHSKKILKKLTAILCVSLSTVGLVFLISHLRHHHDDNIAPNEIPQPNPQADMNNAHGALINLPNGNNDIILNNNYDDNIAPNEIPQPNPQADMNNDHGVLINLPNDNTDIDESLDSLSSSDDSDTDSSDIILNNTHHNNIPFPQELLSAWHVNTQDGVLRFNYYSKNIFNDNNLTPDNKSLMRQLFNWHIAKSKNLTPMDKFYEINVVPQCEWRLQDISNYSDNDLKKDVKKLWPNPTKIDSLGDDKYLTLDNYLFTYQGGMYNFLNPEAKDVFKRIVLTTKHTKEQINKKTDKQKKTYPYQRVSELLDIVDGTITDHEGHCVARLLAIINETSKCMDQIEKLLESEETEIEETVHSDDIKNDIHSFKLSITKPLDNWYDLEVSNYSDDDLKNDINLLWPEDIVIDQFHAPAADMLFDSRYSTNKNGKSFYDNLNDDQKTRLKQIVLIIKRLKSQHIQEGNNVHSKIKPILESVDQKVYSRNLTGPFQTIRMKFIHSIPVTLNHYNDEITRIINEDYYSHNVNDYYNSNTEDSIEDKVDDKTEDKANSNIEDLIVTEFKKIAFDKTATEISNNYPEENVMIMNTFKHLYKDIFNLTYISKDFCSNYADNETVTVNDILKAFTDNLNYDNLTNAAKSILSLVTEEDQESFYNDILHTVKLTFDDYCKFSKIKNKSTNKASIKNFADDSIKELDPNDDYYDEDNKTFTSLKNWVDGNGSMSLMDLFNIYTNNVIFSQYKNTIEDFFNMVNLNEVKQKQFAADHPEILYLYLADKGYFQNFDSARL